MSRYVALLRGINVGGKNSVPMIRLRAVLEELGFTDVATYIASGNVILESERGADETRALIEEALPREFALHDERVRVLVLSQGQLQAIVDNRPKGFGSQPDRYHSDAIFLMGIERRRGDGGLRSAPGRGHHLAGRRGDLLAAAQRRANQEPAQQDHGHAGVQVHDDPELEHNNGGARNAARPGHPLAKLTAALPRTPETKAGTTVAQRPRSRGPLGDSVPSQRRARA